MKRTATLLFAVLVVSAVARADGGRLRLSTTAGPFLVTLFTTPEPLTPGPVDFSVMVQDAKTGQVLTDAAVVLELNSPGCAAIRAEARPGLAANRLLQAAEFRIPSAGQWRVQVSVKRAGEVASIGTDVSVETGSRKGRLVWIFGLLPLLVILLFVLHQRQRGALRSRSVRV